MLSLPEDPKALVREVVAGYSRVSLLTYANAIAFQVVFALVPLLLFMLGLAGFLGLEDLYDDDLQPELAQSTSANVFVVLDDTLSRVLSSGQTFWVTAGALFTVWKMSGAMRAVMGVFERIYEERRRGPEPGRAVPRVDPARRRRGVLAARRGRGDPLPAGACSAGRSALVLMSATVALIVHYAPAERPPVAVRHARLRRSSSWPGSGRRWCSAST